MAPKVLVIMGSDSDWPTMQKCTGVLKEFKVEYEARVISAHRTPDVAGRVSRQAKGKGVKVIICAAGMAAHLAGNIAAHTILPIIGVPIKSGALQGQDALLATVQMPPGVPVATVGIDGAKNAALLAIQILSLSDNKLSEKLLEFKKSMAVKVKQADKKIKKDKG